MSLPVPALWMPTVEPPCALDPVRVRIEPPSLPDQRWRAMRIPARAALRWSLDGQQRAALTGDVSRGGLSVFSPDIPPVGAVVRVDLRVQLPWPGIWPVSLRARVCWCRDNPVLAPPSTQFGLEILAFRDAAHEARWEAYVGMLSKTVIVMEV